MKAAAVNPQRKVFPVRLSWNTNLDERGLAADGLGPARTQTPIRGRTQRLQPSHGEGGGAGVGCCLSTIFFTRMLRQTRRCWVLMGPVGRICKRLPEEKIRGSLNSCLACPARRSHPEITPHRVPMGTKRGSSVPSYF